MCFWSHDQHSTNKTKEDWLQLSEDCIVAFLNVTLTFLSVWESGRLHFTTCVATYFRRGYCQTEEKQLVAHFFYWIIYCISNTVCFWVSKHSLGMNPSQPGDPRKVRGSAKRSVPSHETCLSAHAAQLSSATACFSAFRAPEVTLSYCIYLCVDTDYVCISSPLNLNCHYLCQWMCVDSTVCPCLHIWLWGHVCSVDKVFGCTQTHALCSFQRPHQHSVLLPPPFATSAGDHQCVLLTFLAAWGQKPHISLLCHFTGREEATSFFLPFFTLTQTHYL